MQEAAFKAVGLKAFYLALEMGLPGFRQVMKNRKRLSLAGFNVTVPYKEAAGRYLDHVTSEAKAIGAVNTVYQKGRAWWGTNTDVYGFLTSLREEGRMDPKGKRAIILGAGGSARAVVYGLASRKASHILIANRHEARAKKLAAEFKRLFRGTVFEPIPLEGKRLKPAIVSADLIVNCTSVGLKPEEASVLAPDWIPRASKKSKPLFYDLIYRPFRTKLLKTAEQKGYTVLNGAGMLVHQGAKSFEYWTGKKAPIVLMRKTLQAALQNKNSFNQ